MPQCVLIEYVKRPGGHTGERAPRDDPYANNDFVAASERDDGMECDLSQAGPE